MINGMGVVAGEDQDLRRAATIEDDRAGNAVVDAVDSDGETGADGRGQDNARGARAILTKGDSLAVSSYAHRGP